MKDFKKGDRVRIKDKSHVESSPLLNYAYLMVIDINDDNVTLGMPGTNLHLIVETEFLELYKSPDPKTAFLTEMQALLEKYDVSIGTFEGCTVPTMPYGIMFGSRCQDRGDIYVFYDMPVISSDDIFDYEKE